MKYQLTQHISLTQIEDEAVLLDLNSGRYFGLNHTGAKFIMALIGGAAYESAVLTVANQYQMDQLTVAADLESLLDQLLKEALVEQVQVE